MLPTRLLASFERSSKGGGDRDGPREIEAFGSLPMRFRPSVPRRRVARFEDALVAHPHQVEGLVTAVQQELAQAATDRRCLHQSVAGKTKRDIEILDLANPRPENRVAEPETAVAGRSGPTLANRNIDPLCQ